MRIPPGWKVYWVDEHDRWGERVVGWMFGTLDFPKHDWDWVDHVPVERSTWQHHYASDPAPSRRAALRRLRAYLRKAGHWPRESPRAIAARPARAAFLRAVFWRRLKLEAARRFPCPCQPARMAVMDGWICWL